MTPLIAVTHNYHDANWGVGRNIHAESNYCRALVRAGAAPMITGTGDAAVYAERCDGILFVGGANDVTPSLYRREENGARGMDLSVDREELALFSAFYRAGKPILGICRGIQLINVAMGGTLVQDIPSQVTLSAHKPVYEENICRHLVTTAEGSVLRGLFGETVEVNSYHHQAVETCGWGLRPAAVTDEGVIEAIEHESLPILGIQWHPERMIREESFELPDMSPVFSYFVSLCKKGEREADTQC